MKVFISWSGEHSKRLGLILRDWLPLMLQYVQPYLSEKDIAAGDRWAINIAKGLEDSTFGIICVTRENLNAPWVMFEAGALSKAITSSSVCPLLLDVDYDDIAGPLSQFQAKKIDKESIFELVNGINSRANSKLDQARIAELFSVIWPKLEERIVNLSSSLQRGRGRDSISKPATQEEILPAIRSLEENVKNIGVAMQRDGGYGKEHTRQSQKMAKAVENLQEKLHSIERELQAQKSVSRNDSDRVDKSLRAFLTPMEGLIQQNRELILLLGEHIKISNQFTDNRRNKVLFTEWGSFVDQYAVGDTLDGKVVSVKDEGLFMDIYMGIIGLVLASEIDLPGELEDRFRIGEWVSGRILRIEEEKKKVELTMKGVPQPEEHELTELEAAYQVQKRMIDA